MDIKGEGSPSALGPGCWDRYKHGDPEGEREDSGSAVSQLRQTAMKFVTHHHKQSRPVVFTTWPRERRQVLFYLEAK
jgi:hypothetical protein